MTSTDAPLLAVRSLRKVFGGVIAVDEVSLEIGSGEVVAVIGPNGSGKSTLFNTISGYHRATSGQILWKGRPLRRITLSGTSRLGLVRTFQEATNFPGLTVRQCIALASMPRRGAQPNPLLGEDLLGDLLETTGLARFADAQAGSLPYGFSRMLGVVMAVCMRPTLLMLDEPAAGLSRADVDRLSTLLRKLQGAGLTLAIVDHDMSFIFALADRVIVLDAGVIIFEGIPEDVANDAHVREAYLGDTHAGR